MNEYRFRKRSFHTGGCYSALRREDFRTPCYHGDETQDIMLREGTGHKKACTVPFHLNEVLRVIEIKEGESRVGAGAGQGEGSHCLLGTEFGFARWQSSGGGGWRRSPEKVNVLNALELHTSKWLQRSTLCFFYHNFLFF